MDNENFHQEFSGRSQVEELKSRLKGYKEELEDIDKFVVEQLGDENESYGDRTDRANMFARHFREVFIISGLLKEMEDALNGKDKEKLELLVSKVELEMGFFRMFKNKNWHCPPI
jgi:hypothetical protein